MKTKYFLIFLVLILSLLYGKLACAQRCLTYAYDADGNRVQRAVTNNCDGAREIEEAQDMDEIMELTVYPNPTDGGFKIIMPDDIMRHPAGYQLFDMNGVMMREDGIQGKDTNVDISDLPAGVYLVRIVSGEEVYIKIVLKH